MGGACVRMTPVGYTSERQIRLEPSNLKTGYKALRKRLGVPNGQTERQAHRRMDGIHVKKITVTPRVFKGDMGGDIRGYMVVEYAGLVGRSMKPFQHGSGAAPSSLEMQLPHSAGAHTPNNALRLPALNPSLALIRLSAIAKWLAVST